MININNISFTKIKGGMTNLNYKLVINDNPYIIRIPGKASNLLINRKEEYDILQKIINKGLDVETIYFNTNDGIKITRYIENFPHKIYSVDQRSRTIAHLLRKLHYSELVFENNFHPLEKINQYESIMEENNISFEKDYLLLKDKIYQKYQILNDKILFPCHNDIVLENIIFGTNNTTYLIDWEYAGMNNPIWDLASYSLENKLSESEENKFLNYYYNYELNNDVLKKIYICKICQDFLWSLWASIKSHFGDNYIEYGRMRYNRAKSMLKV